MSKVKNRKKTGYDVPNGDYGNSVVLVHTYPKLIEWTLGNVFSIAENKITLILFLVTLPFAILAYYPSILGDYDVWFHLAYGKHFVENLTWSIDHSAYSWTPTIADWKYVTWIGSSIIYIIYWLAGIPGLYSFQYMLMAGMFFMLYRFIKRLNIKFQIWHLLNFLLIAIAIKIVSIFIKPEMFTTFFFVITVFVLFWARTFKYHKLLFLYPLLFLVWVNTHGGFLFGLFFISAFLVFDAIFYYLRLNKEISSQYLRHLTLAAGFSYLFILINPYGLEFHIDMIKYFFMPEYMGSARRLYAYINLWDHVRLTMNSVNFVNSALTLLFFISCYIALSMYAFFKKNIYDLTLLFVNLIFFFISMSAARLVLFYPFIWFFSFHFLLWRCNLQKIGKNINLITLLQFVAVSCFCFYISVCVSPDRTWFGLGYEDYIPKKESEYIVKHHLDAPLFNDYLSGGYLLWAIYPDYKVFIDPRYGPYVNQVLTDWFDIGTKYPPTNQGLEMFLAKYPIKTAIIHVAYGNYITWFLNHKDWRLAFFDKTAAVIIHKSKIPELSKEALDTDLSTGRFINLSNPTQLINLFEFYIYIGAIYGQELRNIYAKNVSDFYNAKTTQLAYMDQKIVNRSQAVGAKSQ